MKIFKQLKRKLLKNPEIKKAYDNLEAKFALIERGIKKSKTQQSHTRTVSCYVGRVS